MAIDFSRLNSLSRVATERTETPLEGAEGWKPKEVPAEASAAANKLRNEADSMEQARAVYGKYQEAIRLSEDGMTDIIKAVNAGDKDYKSLFLQACKVVSMTTADSVFYEHISKAIQ